MNDGITPPDALDLSPRRSREIPPPESFVLKVWLVQDGSSLAYQWHGRITQIPSGEQIYVRTFTQIVWFVALHLERMGARMPLFWRMTRWWFKRQQLKSSP